MNVSFQTHNLFHTPKDAAELSEWIERHPPADRVCLYTVQGMTSNLIAQNVAKATTLTVVDSAGNTIVFKRESGGSAET